MGAATPMKVGKLRFGFRMCNVVASAESLKKKTNIGYKTEVVKNHRHNLWQFFNML